MMALPTVSFLPPTPRDPYGGATTAASSSGVPDWALLLKSPRICDRRNATTAECHTEEGQAIEVSFWLVDPPGVSYFSVHCPGLKENDFCDEPSLICAEGALVLISLTINVPDWRSTHYLVYRAGPGKPSLRLFHTHPGVSFCHFGLLPCGDEHFTVAFLDRSWITGEEAWDYDVQIFSSEAQAWSSKRAVVNVSSSDKASLFLHHSNKRFTVGATTLGWADLMHGVLLLSNLFDETPVIKFIALPASRIRITDKHGGDVTIAWEYVFDVACCEDLIKFVELQFDDPDDRSSGHGWRATTWNRKISWDDWCKQSTVRTAKISIDQSYQALLPELWEEKTQQLELKKLNIYTPTLSIRDDDLVYITSKVNHEDDKAWVVALDVKHGSLEAIGMFSTQQCYHVTMLFPCAFPKYLGMTPGADIANPVGEYLRMSAAHSVLEVLWTQDWFCELDQCLESERSTYTEWRLLIHRCPVPSLRLNIRALVNYASCNGQGEAASEAVDFCLRALEDFDKLLRESLTDPSTSTEALRSKISVALRALDNILQIVPPTVMARRTTDSDACNQNQEQAISEHCDEAPLIGKLADTEDYNKSHDFPNAKLSDRKKPRRKKNKSYKSQQRRLIQQARDRTYWVCLVLGISLTCVVSWILALNSTRWIELLLKLPEMLEI